MKKQIPSQNAAQPAVPARQDLAAARRQSLAASGQQALEQILRHPLPASLVQSFAETDFHLLVHEIGVADALPLVAMASNDQLQYLLDAEIWNRDRLDNTALTRWMGAMVRADAGRMIAYLVRSQPELVEYFFWRNLQLVIREHDQDPSVFGDDFFTLDNVFYLRILPEATPEDLPEGMVEDRDAFLRSFIERLAEHDYERFRDLLLESASLIPAEHEEEALRQRTVRQAEKGFLPFEEAVGIYQPLAAGALAQRGVKRFQWQDGEGRPLPVPRYAAGAIPARGAFAEALAACAAQEDLSPIEAEFAALCNRLAVADNRVVHERAAIEALARKAAGYIGIALETLASEQGRLDPGRAADRIRRHSLEDLFRVGFGAVVQLKRKVELWQRRSWWRASGLQLPFWLEEGMGVLGGLLIKRPRFFDNYRGGTLYREFETLADLTATARVLDNIMAIDDLLGKMRIAPTREPADVPLHWKNLLLTLWTCDRLGLDERRLTIGIEDLRVFFGGLWTAEGKIRIARRREFLQWLAGRSGQDLEAVSSRLAAVLEALFRELEDEYGRVAPQSLDRRFVTLFRVA